MKIGRFIKYLCIFLLISNEISAQEILEVVTKKIEKTLDFSSDSRLNIEGEKADVLINTWHESKVKVELTLVAKHRDLQVARKDIETITYLIERREKRGVVEVRDAELDFVALDALEAAAAERLIE